MDEVDVIISLSLATTVLFVSTLGFAIAWVRSRERRLRDQAALPAREIENTRAERIEQAIDAIATEVERLAESQRFMSRLLSERERAPVELPAPKPQGAERATTPH